MTGSRYRVPFFKKYFVSDLCSCEQEPDKVFRITDKWRSTTNSRHIMCNLENIVDGSSIVVKESELMPYTRSNDNQLDFSDMWD